MRCQIVLVILWTLANSSVAADLPELVLPQGVGVNIHFTGGHEGELDLIAAAGFKVVRMDFAWDATERRKGEYDWSAYDELTKELEKRGLRALYILDYSNELYEPVVERRDRVSGKPQRILPSPQHAESIAAFARWAAAAVRHFRGRRIIWEIWNEPNGAFWKPKPDVRQYTALALAACRAIRQADQQSTIVAPASSRIPMDFLEAFFSSGILAELDAVSVHPYRARSRPPERAAADYRKLRLLIERYAPAPKKQMPILSGEWGYASHSRGVSPKTQAAFLARQQLSNLLCGVPLSIWYDWKDDGTNPDESEHHFGTMTIDLKPKPAYLAARTLTHELAGYWIVRRLSTGNEKDFVLLLKNAAGRRKFAAWTTSEAHAVRLDGLLRPKEKVSAVTGGGKPFVPKAVEKTLVLELSASPQYVAIEDGPD